MKAANFPGGRLVFAGPELSHQARLDPSDPGISGK